MRYAALAAAAVLALTLSAGPAAAQPAQSAAPVTSTAASPALAAALAARNRDADRARDQYRHPAETLAFLQVEPGMKVGEYAPGGGWYSRVLGNYLSPQGKLVGLFFTPEEGVFDEKTREAIRKGAAGFPAQVETWTARPAAGTQGLTLDTITDADKGSFDRVLVIRMLHNMMRWNFADSELKAMRGLLKPGGMLGIVQHRAKDAAPGDYADGTKGYLRQKDVIGLVEGMGFELVGTSEVNANPRDTADHAGGVWEMKPSWQTKRPELM
jgi:predicted methyltransferase